MKGCVVSASSFIVHRSSVVLNQRFERRSIGAQVGDVVADPVGVAAAQHRRKPLHACLPPLYQRVVQHLLTPRDYVEQPAPIGKAGGIIAKGAIDSTRLRRLCRHFLC